MAEPFKERINRESIALLGRRLAAVSQDSGVREADAFDERGFLRAATRGLGKLELKDRVRHVAKTLKRSLHPEYKNALAHILASLGPELEGTDAVSSGMFINWPLLQFVEDHASDESVPLEEHFDASMRALEQLTKTFSAEFAVRPFLERAPDRTLSVLEQFATSENVHVRRLASEGTRPRLPWGIRLNGFIEDPKKTQRILDWLKDDPELYVRRSVANHLNDISKDHPEVALALCERWQEAKRLSRAKKERRAWITKHALRGLIKAGEPRALTLVGFGAVKVKLLDFSVEPTSVNLGDTAALQAELRSKASRSQDLLIDYVVHFKKANGSNQPKVFKGGVFKLEAGQTLSFRRNHAFREVTTRKHYPGKHFIELQVNGKVLGRCEVELTT